MARIPQDIDPSPVLSLAEVNEEEANIQCQLNLCRKNVAVLSESIINLSQEVEHVLLRKKWSSKLSVDKGTGCEQIRSPVEDALAICLELRTSPEYSEDISAAFKKRQASLQETIKCLTKEIDELKKT